MKTKLSVLLIVAVLCSLLTGCAGTANDTLYASEIRKTESPEWVQNLPSAQDASVKQLFVVAGTGMDLSTAAISIARIRMIAQTAFILLFNVYRLLSKSAKLSAAECLLTVQYCIPNGFMPAQTADAMPRTARAVHPCGDNTARPCRALRSAPFPHRSA